MNDITEPLLGQFVPLTLKRQVIEAVRVSEDELLDFLHAQAFVLGDSKMHDIICQYHLLGPADQVL